MSDLSVNPLGDPPQPAGTLPPIWQYGPLGLIAAALLWLVFDGLGYGPRTAAQLENDSVAMTVHVQQNARLSRIQEALESLKDVDTTIGARTLALGELRDTTPQFSEMLQRMVTGGVLVAPGETNELNLGPPDSPKILAMLQGVESTWGPLSESLELLVNSADLPPREAVLPVAERLRAALPQLHQAMANVALEAGKRTQAWSRRLRWIQTGIGSLVLGLGGCLWWLAHRSIRQSAARAESLELLVRQTRSRMDVSLAKASNVLQEHTQLLDSIQQGLLVIDPKFRIGHAYSKECEKLFGKQNLAGTSLVNVLQGLIPEKLLGTTRDYLDLLFNPSKKEKPLARINPLHEVEVASPDNGDGARFWEFGFRRLLGEGNKITAVFVNVQDVTAAVRTREELKTAENLKERQFEILASVLQVEPTSFGEFLNLAEQEFKRAEESVSPESLAAAGPAELSPTALRQRLDTAFRAAHSVKGHAAFIGATSFVERVHELENLIQKLRGKTELQPEDLLSVKRHYDNLGQDLRLARGVVNRLGTFHRFATDRKAAGQGAPANSVVEVGAAVPPATTPAGLVPGLNQLLQRLAGQLGKQVRLETSRFPEELLANREPLVREILIQLGRNTMAHGLELPAERRSAGKPPTGTINLILEPDEEVSPGGLALVYRDDGRGLDPDLIRARAIALNLMSPEELAEINDSEVVLLIFEPGFSTSTNVDELSGRGIGLDLIRQRVVDESAGEISVDSVPGQFCEFRFHFPPVSGSLEP